MSLYKGDAPVERFLTMDFDSASHSHKGKHAYHPFRYFVAGGETLRAIKAIIADAEFLKNPANLKAEQAKIAVHANAREYAEGLFQLDGWTEDDLVVNPEMRTSRILPARPEFIKWTNGFAPARNNDRGKALAELCQTLRIRRDPVMSFAKWMDSLDVDTNPGGYTRFSLDDGRPNAKMSATAQKIGNQWIIAVPVIGEGSKDGFAGSHCESWAIPPDSKPLKVSAFFKMLEDRKMLSVPVI